MLRLAFFSKCRSPPVPILHPCNLPTLVDGQDWRKILNSRVPISSEKLIGATRIERVSKSAETWRKVAFRHQAAEKFFFG
ncbi:hypothetical protein FKM82_022865 [Ascaphus truei]